MTGHKAEGIVVTQVVCKPITRGPFEIGMRSLLLGPVYRTRYINVISPKEGPCYTCLEPTA